MPVCQTCGVERKPEDKDYTPVQVILNQPLGWYSGEDDGELCGQCMTNILRNQ